MSDLKQLVVNKQKLLSVAALLHCSCYSTSSSSRTSNLRFLENSGGHVTSPCGAKMERKGNVQIET